MKMQAWASLFRGRTDICSIFLDLEENQLRELQAPDGVSSAWAEGRVPPGPAVVSGVVAL